MVVLRRWKYIAAEITISTVKFFQKFYIVLTLICKTLLVGKRLDQHAVMMLIMVVVMIGNRYIISRQVKQSCITFSHVLLGRTSRGG
jgi:hypothetical protein